VLSILYTGLEHSLIWTSAAGSKALEPTHKDTEGPLYFLLRSSAPLCAFLGQLSKWPRPRKAGRTLSGDS
jgi:hypothetical protein